MNLSCEQALDGLLDYARLTPAARTAVDAHLAACPVCRAESARVERVQDLFAGLGSEAPPPDFAARVMAALPAAESPVAAPALWPLALLLAALAALACGDLEQTWAAVAQPAAEVLAALRAQFSLDLASLAAWWRQAGGAASSLAGWDWSWFGASLAIVLALGLAVLAEGPAGWWRQRPHGPRN